MSEVHRYRVVKMLSEEGNRITYAPHGGPAVVLASGYDALAQRCRELDIEASRLSGWLGACDRERLAAQQERDALRAEVELLGRIARSLVRTYIVSDDAYDPEAETDRAICRIKAQFSAT